MVKKVNKRKIAAKLFKIYCKNNAKKSILVYNVVIIYQLFFIFIEINDDIIIFIHYNIHFYGK